MTEFITFRRMTLDDVDAVWELEKEAFPTPWSREAFVNEMLANRFAYYIVGENQASEVIAFCGMWLVTDECHITNVAVTTCARGNGFGEALMREAIRVTRENGGRVMTLEVRVSNDTAQNLYRKLGFQEGGIRKNYYTDTHEDALVMWVEFT
ncbi:ribosomal-protein-alanine N-acetyltransferase [Chryseomicrobium aureum]|uniref:ribosomal protein S18-alanine N-acetyltransferase n=1 Tax=Chryseomicrobium aureum TaxID=1441723 RepID=UPI00195B5802|nr:ribosomal protein S18-alanine N-acetyltransferase [Chryseomicrobium aureum]MBM7707117.1 ribosomal-protein-alanine N-acetyltransferase [Chryseomicrobium aureum]